jgi:hypothetical protein
MMKKWLVSLAVVVALAASGVAQATPTVTGHTGYVDSSFVAFTGDAFTNPPAVAYMWGFEDNHPEKMHIGRVSDTMSRCYPSLSFGTTNANRFFFDLLDSTGTYPDAPYGSYVNEWFASVSADYAKFGNYSLKIRASEYNAFRDSISAVRNYIAPGGVGLESIYASTWFKITADDTTMSGSGAADSPLSRFSLIRFVGQTPLNNIDFVKIRADNDSLRTWTEIQGVPETGEGAFNTWDLVSSSNDKFSDIANGNWHRLDVFAMSESTPASSSDGKIRVYLDYALVDSSGAIDWPSTTTGWVGVQLVPIVTPDDGRKLNVYFDDLYIAGGHSTTVDRRALARVEFQDKIVFGNATERYVQFPVSWGATAIVCRQTGGFDATDKVYVMPVPSGGDLLLQADTCLDSLQSAVPVLGSAAITTAATTNYPGTWQKFGWNDTADNGRLGRDSKKSKTIIDWGDGTTTLLSAAGDTTAAHNYSQAGTFAINVTATNAAGSTTKETSYEVYSNRTRFLTASGSKVTLPAARDPGRNQATISAASACRVKTWKSGTGDVMSWPIEAGVPWTITDFDSLASSTVASGDTVWVHVW